VSGSAAKLSVRGKQYPQTEKRDKQASPLFCSIIDSTKSGSSTHTP